MSKFSIDYSTLENKIYKKAYRLSEVKDKIQKVAFDIVKFKDDDKGANLWQIQNSDDGEYIIALYQSDENSLEKQSWDVEVNKTANALQISYKNDPILVINASKLGIPRNELDKVSEYLPEKLSENKKLVKSLLKELDAEKRALLINKYPELV